MRNSLAVVAVLLLACPLAGSAAMAKGAGKSKPATEQGTWNVTVTPGADAAAKGEKESADTLVLKGGKFHSTGCDAYGFGPASYKVDGNHWMADTESKKDGKIHWHGAVSGESVSGQMTWTKTDGSVLNYTFSGSRAGDAPQTQKTD